MSIEFCNRKLATNPKDLNMKSIRRFLLFIYQNMILLGMLLTFQVAPFLYAQTWRFPNCTDLEVSQININNLTETVQIDIYNHCDTCMQHVYTGLIVFGENDTLARSQELFSGRSPDNKSTESYTLISNKAFMISDITKIQMVAGICDSIPLKEAILGIQGKESHGFTVFPNPASEWLFFKNIAPTETFQLTIFDARGRTVKHLEFTSPKVFIGDVPPGIYFLSIKAQNLVLHKRLVIQ